MVPRSRSVRTPVEFTLLGSGPDVRIAASLKFRSDDPYAVRVVFHNRGDQDDIEWMFARQLLSIGLLVPVGEGDVCIWPEASGVPVINLHLRSPFGEATFQVERGYLVDFMLRTYALVPPGCESGFLDLDAELALLHDDPA